MAPGSQIDSDGTVRQRRRLEKKRWRFTLAFTLMLLGILAYAYVTREDIAQGVITDQLEAYDLEADYTIKSVGPDVQVLTDVVVGDPDNPDFTADRITVHLRYRFGAPAFGRLELVRPRLYGALTDDGLSFGSLDRAIYAESEGPGGLPDLDLLLVDARALIRTPYGAVGIKAEGEGELDDGFDGIIAVAAPRVEVDGCEPFKASIFGNISVSDGMPRLHGPMKLRDLECREQGLALARLDWEVDLKSDPRLSQLMGTGDIAINFARFAGVSIDRIGADIGLSLKDGTVALRLDGSAERLSHPQASLAALGFDGVLRARSDFSHWDSELSLTGEGVAAGRGLLATLRGLQDSAQGTLAAPLADKLRRGIIQASGEGTLRADIIARQRKDELTVSIPNAVLRGSSARSIASLSQARLSLRDGLGPRWSGNLSTGGPGLPRITARMEQGGDTGTAMRFRMEPYAAEGQMLAIPELRIVQTPAGILGFAGMIRASGAIPGGQVKGLSLPVTGNWSEQRGLSVGTRCSEARFQALELSDLALQQGRVTVCPGSGQPILRSDAAGISIAAGIPELKLGGMLGDTPVSLSTGAVGVAWPGAITAKQVDVALGPADTASRFTISTIDARFGETIGGGFNDATIMLDAVPLNLVETRGTWDYSEGVLRIDDSSFTLVDRESEARFQPLAGRSGQLTLEDNRIVAQAELVEPETTRTVVLVDIVHDLATGRGFADLDVPGLLFDDKLQPAARSASCIEGGGRGSGPPGLTCSLLGVVANAQGVVTGTGRIDWNEDEVTSSGAFSSEDFDLAAAFGPVEGLSGTVVFDDLLALTTAPDQTLQVGAINPGVEIFDGEIAFAMREGQFLSVRGGSWPFMGGTLRLRPVDLNLGVDEQRSYILEIIGLDAAIFVEQMELGNLAARGIFDGEVPLIFDEAGNGRIVGGELVSRPPGGNLSYVGELTYEDMGAIANFAFQSLRSLDFNSMAVEMNGPLTGEIITRLRFDGVTQGEGAKRNFLTKRIGKLPLQFRVNIKADFYSLINDLKSLYDPAFVRDPRELGLLESDGAQLVPPARPQAQAIKPEDLNPEKMNGDEPPIQTQESETMP